MSIIFKDERNKGKKVCLTTIFIALNGKIILTLNFISINIKHMF